jgi:uncharacterized membrane protein YcaP (DUF421 family)
MVECGLPKPETRVRFPSPAPIQEVGPHSILRSFSFWQHVTVNSFNELLGLGLKPDQLTAFQICLRGFIIFFITIVTLRMGHKRFLAQRTAFDMVLALILASSLSRAINGSAPFFQTILMGFLLIFLHQLIAALSCRYPKLDDLIKGSTCDLIVDGKIQQSVARKHAVSMKDLEEDIRLDGNVDDFSKIKIARLERNGEISVVRNEKETGSEKALTS